jgi:hypothetical protein
MARTLVFDRKLFALVKSESESLTSKPGSTETKAEIQAKPIPPNHAHIPGKQSNAEVKSYKISQLIYLAKEKSNRSKKEPKITSYAIINSQSNSSIKTCSSHHKRCQATASCYQ